MATKHVVEEIAGFWSSDFRADVQQLNSLDQTVFQRLVEFAKNAGATIRLSNENGWIPLSKELGLPIDEVFRLVSPALFVARVALVTRVSIETIINELVTYKIINDGTRLLNLAAAVEPAVRWENKHADPIRAEGMLFRLENIRSRCLLIPQFEPEFDLKQDDPSSYSPSIEKLQPFVLLQLSFREGFPKQVSLVLTRDDLHKLITWLTFASKQLDMASERISTKGGGTDEKANRKAA